MQPERVVSKRDLVFWAGATTPAVTQAKPPDQVCEWCQRRFTPQFTIQPYCSLDCRLDDAAHKRRWGGRDETTPVDEPTLCANCEIRLTGKGTGRPLRFCSRSCTRLFALTVKKAAQASTEGNPLA